MNKYAQLTHEQLEEHFSNYLIDSWSYSGVSCFARNFICDFILGKESGATQQLLLDLKI